MNIKRIVEENDTRSGQIFDVIIQLLIVLSLVTFSIATLPGISENTLDALYVVEVITVLIFTFEYILRIAVADRKLNYIFSFYGLIDLLAILPFYINHAVDLRSLRVVRLLRLFRIFRFVSYSKALKRYKRALSTIKEELVIFIITTSFIIYISAVGIYYFENAAQPEKFQSIFHSLWWAVATLTTVGYGDIYPVTVGGKVFTYIILMVGLGIVAVPAGLLASALQHTVGKSDNRKSGR